MTTAVPDASAQNGIGSLEEQSMVGFCWSITVTFCVHVFVLPLLSITVHVTLVMPFGNSAGASFFADEIVHEPAIVGATKVTFEAEHLSGSVLTVLSSEQVILHESLVLFGVEAARISPSIPNKQAPTKSAIKFLCRFIASAIFPSHRQSVQIVQNHVHLFTHNRSGHVLLVL